MAGEDHVSAIDVFLGIGWLHSSAVQSWRQGRLACLEEVMQASPERVAEAMAILGAWATREGLVPSEAEYVARTTQRQVLRFSRSGHPSVEQLFRTHWMSGALSEKKRERLVEKASRPPELVVIQPLNREWTCHRCGGTGDLLIMEDPGPCCLTCAGMGDLEFLPAGNALLTRRAKAKSARSAVVVRFSRARKRYERKGLLVEKAALEEAERAVAGAE